MSNKDNQPMLDFITRLFPICRSITGDGVRKTLDEINRIVPLKISEIPSGTKVFDWTVPNEWNIKGGFLDSPTGDRIVDFDDCNLHVLNYSSPVDVQIELASLQEHLYSLPCQPDLIPYRTSYYTENWGFCLSDNARKKLSSGTYRAVIDSTLSPGSLTLGEFVVPGESSEEILIYSHVCHPSLANDNLSGIAVTAWWARHLLDGGRHRYTYRFIWGPGAIGSITWLAMNKARLGRIKHGLVAVLLGRPGEFHYKTTRDGDEVIDKVAHMVLTETASGVQQRQFAPYGYDERQFGSPGVNLPVGRISRTPNGEYPEYHTSGDNLELITEAALQESLEACIRIGQVLDQNRTFENQAPECEPQLGKRGLYRNTGGDNPREREHAILWLLNMSDGSKSLLDVANRSGLPFDILRSAADELVESGLLEELKNS